MSGASKTSERSERERSEQTGEDRPSKTGERSEQTGEATEQTQFLGNKPTPSVMNDATGRTVDEIILARLHAERIEQDEISFINEQDDFMKSMTPTKENCLCPPNKGPSWILRSESILMLLLLMMMMMMMMMMMHISSIY